MSDPQNAVIIPVPTPEEIAPTSGKTGAASGESPATPMSTTLAVMQQALAISPPRPGPRRRRETRKNAASTSVHTISDISQKPFTARPFARGPKGASSTPLQLIAKIHALNKESEAARLRWLDSIARNCSNELSLNGAASGPSLFCIIPPPYRPVYPIGHLPPRVRSPEGGATAPGRVQAIRSPR